MRFFPRSLRSRLLLLVAAAYLPAAALTIWAVQRDREEAFATVEARLMELLEQARQDNDASIAYGRRLTATWAEVPAVVAGDRHACEAALRRLLPFAPTVASPTRIALDGTIDCGGRTPASIGHKVTDNPLFRRVMAGDSIVLGPHLTAAHGDDALVPLNLPLRDGKGRKTALLSVGVRLTWFERLASSPILPPGTIATITDSTGLMIARFPRDTALVGRIMPGLRERHLEDRRLGHAERGVTIRPTSDGMIRLVAHRRLTSAQGTFVRIALGVPPQSLFAGPASRARIRFGLLLATGFVALLVAWYGADLFVLREVERILLATRRLGTGDLTARTGVTEPRGELGQLAAAFDTMASQLEERSDRMRHAERMESLGRLAGGVAHDFNNILTAIVGSADLALDELPDDHPARPDLLTIKASAGRSSTLTRQLLDFSRRTPLSTSPQRLDRLVQEAAALLVRVVPATVTIEVQLRSQRAAQIDAGRIEQAIFNLAVNARDAMPGGGTLTIAIDDVDVAGPQQDARPLPPDGPWIRLSVADTGSGMPPEVVRRIFEPFFTTKPAGDGTGLGLSMVYGTVQHHGGHIYVDSTPGQGTCFTIWLPAVPCEESVADVSAPEHPALLAPATVLVAEDQPEVRLLLKRVLSKRGFDVILAHDGHDAIEKGTALGDRLSLLITDYDMPGARGDSVVTTLRQSQPLLAVVLTSGFAREGWPAELVQSEHTEILEKPFTAVQLISAVTAARAARY